VDDQPAVASSHVEDRRRAVKSWAASLPCIPVRFLAFPLHVLLSLTPSPVLHALGLPDAFWPSSAVLAIVISLPLWGLLLIGGLVAEAWLERVSAARHAREDHLGKPQ